MGSAVEAVAKILSETPVCFVATVCGNKPKVRGFQFQFEADGKLWFCTARNKEVFRQLQANPSIEVCAVKEDMTWVRISGEVILEDSLSVKERILAEQPLIKGIYGSADNPVFTTFCIAHGTYTIADFSGQPPREGTF